jgi:tyrosyl-tRNA synthetase
MIIFPENSDISRLNRVKFGIDPTFPRLHLGHFIPLRFVKKLQDQGKHITLVLGTFTAQMGDPSGRDATRPILTAEEVIKNSEIILNQVGKILSPNFEIFRNHEFHGSMTTPELLGHLSKFTLSHMVSRNAFEKRVQENQSIGLHELIVPILQGLDSVALKTELEIGGQDQLFNFQIARKLQELNGQKPQVSLMLPIINGTDGRKMSKSLGNCIFLDESSNDIFGKIMSISDEVMDQWIPILTDVKDISEHPMIRKFMLAFSVVEQLKGSQEAEEAKKFFEETVCKKEMPVDMPEFNTDTIINIISLFKSCSKSAARRLLVEGGIKVNGQKQIEDSIASSGDLIQIGKRGFVKVK